MRGFLERAAINAPIQGSAADIIRRAMIRMPGALETARLASARMLLQVHDELVFEVDEAEAAAAIEVVCGVMEKASLPAVQLGVRSTSTPRRRTTGRRRIEPHQRRPVAARS